MIFGEAKAHLIGISAIHYIYKRYGKKEISEVIITCQENTNHFIHNNPKFILGQKTEEISAFTKILDKLLHSFCSDSSSLFMKKSVSIQCYSPKRSS